MNVFDVHFSLAKGHPANPLAYADNRTTIVLAETAIEALTKLEAKYPGAKIHNANYKGEREVIS